MEILFVLKQVLINLLSNAIKFTHEGGKVSLIILSNSIENNKITMTFKVIDNGIGISEENQKRIFNYFEQAETGTTRKFGGTGLGLAISNKIINAMNSKILVESKEEIGSTFSFTVSFDIDFSSIEENQKIKWNMNFGVCCNNTIFPELNQKIIGYIEGYGNIIKDFIEIHYENLDAIFIFYNYDTIKRLRTIKNLYPSVPIIYVGNLVHLKSKEASYISDVIDEPLYSSKVMKLLSRYYYNKVQKELSDNIVYYSGKVLVAEDNKINQKLIDVILKKFGINAAFSNNGEEAISAYKADEPDLIFMDIHMPIMDGIKSAEKIIDLQNEGFKKNINCSTYCRCFKY